ncbi:MAG: hypothetical protein HXX12_14815 [Geothrix sp.]|uniref:hypothetical protein n=1 Tax=Geothrix sp. TaxID=1962974 RepID=UPI0017A3FD26|nr:hypothetical protein [Geothrix sp.]NWJ42233.1 hypothetical protein [Geothrix sp.]WIL19800.1 MAG: hypothetical protein QOZ81_002333 [Geothrix sp.]
MRSILRAILAVVLLLGGGAGDWAPAQAPHTCCCGTPSGIEDSCPCPKPEGNRGPSRGACPDRQTVVAPQVSLRRNQQAQRRTEPRPEPTQWAEARVASDATAPRPLVQGRDPDLGRQLAHLGTFRI